MPKFSHTGGSTSGHNSTISVSTHTSSYGRTRFRSFGWFGPSVVVLHGVRYHSHPTKRGSALSFLFSFLMIISFFALFFGLVMFINSNNLVNSISVDYEHYQSMIAYARAKQQAGDNNYIAKAEITEQIQDKNANNKWYIVYKLTFGNSSLTYRSYAVYDSTQIKADELKIGRVIDVAIDTAGVNINTDSVPLDYENMPIERDGEYEVATTQKNIGKWLMIGSGVGIGLFIICNIVVSFKCRELTEIKEESKTKTEHKTKEQEEYEKEVSYCQYCGERITKGTKTCPKCGAKL